jgi:hypothetical protein
LPSPQRGQRQRRPRTIGSGWSVMFHDLSVMQKGGAMTPPF